MPIENVVFDAVGTVMRPALDVCHTYWEVGMKHGSRQSLSGMKQAFWPVFEQVEARRTTFETSETAERAFWNDVVSSIFTDVDSNTQLRILDHLWNHFAEATSWELFPDVVDTMRKLQRASVGLAIASNFDNRLHPICQKLFPSDLTIRVFESAGIGFRKPATQFFQHVANAIACPTDRLMMIGDHLDNDVRAARNCAWHALLINRGPHQHHASHCMLTSESGHSSSVMHTLAILPQLLAEIS